MGNGILSNVKKTKDAPFWNFIFDYESVDIFSHKKGPHVREIIRSLAMLGPSNTSKISDHVLDNTPDSDYGYDTKTGIGQPAPKKRTLIKLYNHLFIGRPKKVKGKKKITVVSRYDGLISSDYVNIVNKKLNEKGRPINDYFLTLKGIFLALGFEYDNDELKKVIKHFSMSSLYFAFINHIMNKTSIELVIEIFIEPLRKVLKNSNILQNEDMRFYFSNIAEHTSHALSQKMDLANKQKNKKILSKSAKYFLEKVTAKDIIDYPNATAENWGRIKVREELDDDANLIDEFQKIGIETIMNNVFYYEKPRGNLYDSLIEFFYKKESREDFYRDFKYEYEDDLVFKVMQGLHFTYYHNLNKQTPRSPRKRLRQSKTWIKHQEFKKSNGTFSGKP